MARLDTDEEINEMSKTTSVKTNGDRGPRLGTQLRGDMACAYEARGQTSADLMLHYSPKAQKDVVLTGQLQFLNFLTCEFDSQIKTLNYAPYSSIASTAGDQVASLIDAEIKMRDDTLVWRRLINSDPDSADLIDDLRKSIGRGALSKVSTIEVLTFEQLTVNPVRLRNALRAVAWIVGARHWPLAESKRKVLTLLERRRFATFDEVLALEVGPNRALVGAAVLDMFCNGVVRGDLAEVPLHGLTRFHLIGDQKC